MWRREWSFATRLYFMNRFVGVWFGLSMLLLVADWSTVKGCEAITVFNMAPMLLLDIVWASFSALRVYAVNGQVMWQAILVFALSLGPFVIDLTAYATTIFVNVQYTRWTSLCAEDSRITVPTFNALMFIGRIPLILADTLVLAVTWRATLRGRRDGAAISMKTPMATLLYRDGTVYFLSALAVNAFQMVLFLYSDRYPIASYFVPIVTPVIVSRCLLDLRSVGKNDTDAATADHSRASADLRTLEFAATMAAEGNGTVGAYTEAEDSQYFAAVGRTTERSGSRAFGQSQETGMEATADETIMIELRNMA